MKTNKEIYRELLLKEESIPIFSHDYWLDAVKNNWEWDVLLYKENDQIIASWPIFKENKMFIKASRTPKFTPKLGPWIDPVVLNQEKDKLGLEKKIFNYFVPQLNNFDWFEQTFDSKFNNWLPLYWNGFNQFTKYTYTINLQQSTEDIFNKFDYSKKKNIKKASKIVEIKFDLDSTEIYKNHIKTLGKVRINYTLNELEKIINAAYKHNCGKTIYAIDEAGNIHASFFFVWDKMSSYNLLSTINPEFRASGATSLLIFEMLKYLKSKTLSFDFGGSMIENVEQSFRRFGAEQQPYFKISKFNSKLIRWYLFLNRRIANY